MVEMCCREMKGCVEECVKNIRDELDCVRLLVSTYSLTFSCPNYD